MGHQRLLNFFNPSAYDYTYSDTYTIPSNGVYTSPATNYVVGSGIRIGSGIGPFLGISVALQAPTMSSSLSTTGVFLDPQGVVNAGSFAPFTAGVAPGELLTLFGANLAAGLQVASTIPFPTTLGKVQVMINNVPAPIYYVSPTQLAVVVPYGVTGTIAKLQVLNDNVPSNAVTEWIGNTAPGVLTQLQNGLGYGDVVHLDGTLVNDKSPAKIGETVSVYLTGLGAVNPAIADGDAGPVNPLANATNPITAFIGGTEAKVGYSGLAPQLAGLYQINLTVPDGVTAGDNSLDIAGPDTYASVCLIAISGAPASSSAAVPHIAPCRVLSRDAGLQSQSLVDRRYIGGAHADLLLHEVGRRALIEGLEQCHFGNRVALGRRQSVIVRLFPAEQSAFAYEHAHRMKCFAVGAYREYEFDAAFAAATKRPLAFVEILVDVAALRRIRLQPAHGGSAG